MSAVRQIGIKILVNAQSVMTELTRAQREFGALGSSAEQASARATRGMRAMRLSLGDIVAGAAGLHVVSSAIQSITNAITAMPRNAFNFSSNLEVSQIGMAGILGSMTAINGQQVDYHTALRISSDMIRQLNDDALRTAATSQELVTVFQALLAPGLSAKMTLDEIRQLTVVGTNAVKSMGLESTQVVQELRDLVAGGITPASSTLATALGLKDSDIAKARASSEGLFAFLMERMKGFEASSEAFGDTFKGKLDQLKEGATRVAADGLEPLIAASKQAVGELGSLFVTIDANKNVTLNTELVAGIKEYATTAAQAMTVGKEWAGALWENRDAAIALGAVWAGIKLGNMLAQTMAVVAAKVELAQTSRLAAMQAAAEAAGNVDVVATTRQKIAAYIAELEAKVASARADVAAQTAQIATLTTTREAIVVARAEVVAKLDATRATMAQAEAQIVAARAAGAQSMALALLREGTQALTAAQARHALLIAELATLGRQQAGVNAAIATSTAAATAATTAATAANGSLAAAQGAASVSGRALGGVLGFVGGPVGLVTTALMLGVTAWSLWGNAGSNAESKVQGAVGRSTPEIIADLDRQIEKLNQRNALAAGGAADLAKRGGADVEALAALKKQIDSVTANSAGQLTPSMRTSTLERLQGEYKTLEGKIRQVDTAQQKLTGNAVTGAGQLSLTLTGSEQAWRKANDGIKTATAAQQEYESKLSASRQAWETFKTALGASGANTATIAARQTEQNQVEKALADERDKKIKEGGASAATAQSHAIDAQIAATKQGYKLLSAQTADGLDEIDSLRKQDLLSESEAMERRTALQLQDIDAQRAALQAELALIKGKKDSAKEQANILGELAELEQKRANVQSKSDRDMREQDGLLLNALEQRIDAAKAAAAQGQESVRVAQLETLEIGKTGAALGELRQARVEEAASQLEAQARTQDGIDLSGEAGKALHAQAQAVRDLAKSAGYNESARMVSDYAKAIDEANAATRYEQGLAGISRRDRDIALEQYRIALDLEKRIAEIRAKNPADAKGAAQLEEQAREAAARAQAGVAAQVNLQEWKQSVQQYDDIFRQGFADMLNSGEDGWKSFTKSLATTFKTTVADQLYKAFAQPFVVKIVASLLGITGAAAMGSGGGEGGAGMLGSLASSAGSTFFGGITTAVSAGLKGATLGAGMMGPTTAGAGGAMGLGNVLAAIPGWGWALGGVAALAALTGLGKTRGATHGGGIYSSAGLSDQDAAQSIAGGLGWADPVTDFTTRANAKLSTQVEGAVTELLTMYSGLGMLAKGAITDLDVIAGFAANGQYADEDAYGYFKVFDQKSGELLTEYSNRKMGTDGDAAWAQYVAALGASMIAQLRDADIPSWMDSILAELGDAPTLDSISQAVLQINKIDTAFGALGQTMDGFSGLSDKAQDALMRASGGIEGLAANAGNFYENFYSEEERMARATAALTQELAKAGVEMPASKEAYRALFEEQLKAGESGAELAAKLLQLSPAFAQVTDAAAQAEKAMLDGVGISGAQIADALRDSMLGRIDASDAGAKIAAMVTDGIYNAVAGDFAGQITDLMTTSIITPVIQAAITGASITEAVSQGAIDNMVAQAQAAASALGQVLNDPAFRAAINLIGAAISSAVGGAAGSSAGAGAGASGSGSSLFAIGGSAGGGYMPPEFQTFGTLASETIESNKKVSELLQKLLNPEKLFENRYKQLDSIATDKRDELVAVQVSRTQGYASTLNRLPGEIAADLQAIQGMKDRLESGGTVADGVIEAMQSQLSAKVTAMAQLENQLREWYLAQARLIAAEDMMALSDEAKTATAKTAELKRTGGLEDPLIKLKESFAQKITAIDEGINAALNAEIAARSADAGDAKALMDKYPLMRQWQMSDDEWADAKKLFGDSIGRNMYADEAQYMRDVIAQMEEGIADLTAEQQTYIDSLNDWYKAQAELLSTEMLVDINQQIKALQAQQEGPLTAIKTAIAKYVKDLTDLGTLDADAQTAIDQLSGLQLTAGRKALYDQLLSPEEMKARNTAQLSADFGLLGTTLPASTDALQSMIDAARAAGKITLADSLLELVPAFIALQGAAGGVGDVLGNLRTATDDAYAALERAVGVQRDLLNESITHLQAVFDMTRDAARALYGEVESASQQSAAAGRAFIDNALANAQTTGYMPDSDALREAIDGVRKGIAAQQGASTFEAERDRLVLAGKLTDLKDIAQPQLTEAQRQLAALEEMLKAERTQIDELRGINTSVLSVADAMTALAAAIAAEKAAASTQGPQPSWNPNDMVFIPGSGSGGGALNEDKDKLPGFAAGINVVPYDMTARIHKGEAVIPERFNPFNPGAQLGQAQQGSGTAELVAEIRALRAEVAALRAAGERTARSTADLLEITDQKSEGGNADRVEVMNVAELASAIAREMAPA